MFVITSPIAFGSTDAAFNLVSQNSTVVTGMAAAEPRLFWSHLPQYLMSYQNLRVFCANPSCLWPAMADASMQQHVEFVVMFLTGAVRKQQGRGFIHYMPQHLSQWSRHLRDRAGGIDLYWGTCSLPDERGFVSLGVSNCYESEILRSAKRVVLEVNPAMPATYGDTAVAIDEVDIFLQSEHPLPSITGSTFTDVEQTIASYVVDLIPDGATIQLGIGGIPNALGKALIAKRDLGVHTEMINDAIMELCRLGVINGRKKAIWPRKVVGAFAYGSPELYEFVRENPMVEFHPASIVNDPYRIGRNHQMISLNTSVEIDVTGQVCSESVGHVELSGVGGAAETHIGAQRSAGGRGIIAIQSTAKGGATSKIVTSLQPGAKVSISRNDIDTVVTEFGVAMLKGKTVPERIKELVKVAHPNFRDELMEESRALLYI